MEKISGEFSFVAEGDKIDARINDIDIINALSKYEGKNIIITIDEIK